MRTSTRSKITDNLRKSKLPREIMLVRQQLLMEAGGMARLRMRHRQSPVPARARHVDVGEMSLKILEPVQSRRRVAKQARGENLLRSVRKPVTPLRGKSAAR